MQRTLCFAVLCPPKWHEDANVRKLSYTRVRELVATLEKYGLQSLHSGGATHVANSGVEDQCFKR